METQDSCVYSPSWRRMPWVAGFYFLFSWICYRHSGTYDEVDHRMALAGTCFFAVVGTIFLARQMCGFPKFVLTADALVQRSWLETKRFAWSRYDNFSPGTSIGPIESISFIDTETGFKEHLFNLTSVPSEVLCKELQRWRGQSVGEPVGIAPNNRWSGRDR
jgi:hypothetical protein